MAPYKSQLRLFLSRYLWVCHGVTAILIGAICSILVTAGRTSVQEALAIALTLLLPLTGFIIFINLRTTNVFEAIARYVKGRATSPSAVDDSPSLEAVGALSEFSYALNLFMSSEETRRQELVDALRFYENFLSASPIPILVSDPDGQITHTNDSACYFFGLDKADVLSATLSDMLGESDFDIIKNYLDTETQDASGFISVVDTKGGSKKITELNISRLTNLPNRAPLIIISLIDVTEVTEIQREILHQQTEIAEANQNLTQKALELESAITRNQQNTRKLGTLIKLARQATRFTAVDDILDVLLHGGQQLLGAEESFIFLYDKQSHSLQPLRTSEKSKALLLTPIGENKGALWQTFAQNKPYSLGSDSIEAIDIAQLGREVEDNVCLIAVPISDEQVRYGIAVYLRDERSNKFSIEGLHLINTLANQIALTLDKTHLVRILNKKAGHLQLANEELKRSQQQVLQLQKMESLGTLVGGIAHDFNNILGIITPNMDLLMMNAENEERLTRRINVIQEAVERATSLTEQLLMFSRNQDVELAPLSTNQVIRRVIDMLKRSLGKKIKINTYLDSEVSNMMADETRLVQVLMNLSLNARDAMDGAGELTFESTQESMKPLDQPRKDYIRISVSDTGEGISHEIRDKIFDPFFTTKGPGKGTGLGLSVVYGIVKSHKGYLEVESELGQGSTFHLFFPKTNLPVVQQINPPSQSDVRDQISVDGTEILVVDDEVLIRDSLQSSLNSLGFTVHLAGSGQEALNIAKAFPQIGIAVVDLAMPDMDGIETIQGLRALGSDIKILLSSGYSNPDEITRKSEFYDGFLAKPYHIHDLSQELRKLLSAPNALKNDLILEKSSL